MSITVTAHAAPKTAPTNDSPGSGRLAFVITSHDTKYEPVVGVVPTDKTVGGKTQTTKLTAACVAQASASPGDIWLTIFIAGHSYRGKHNQIDDAKSTWSWGAKSGLIDIQQSPDSWGELIGNLLKHGSVGKAYHHRIYSKNLSGDLKLPGMGELVTVGDLLEPRGLFSPQEELPEYVEDFGIDPKIWTVKKGG